MKKKIVLIAVCVLVLIAAFSLYPAKVEKSYTGAAFSNLEDNSFELCSLSLSGRLHTRFLPNAEYKGTISLHGRDKPFSKTHPVPHGWGRTAPALLRT